MEALTFFNLWEGSPKHDEFRRYDLRITFEGANPSEAIKFINKNNTEKPGMQDDGFSASAMSALVDIGNNNLTVPGTPDQKHSLLAGISRDASVGTDVLENYMVVMTHTLSGEDLKKASEDGFDLKNMTPEDSVTILDKVKAEVAKGGEVVRGFNDDLDSSVLDDAANAGLESVISDSLQNAGLPETSENIKAVKNAVDLASELEKPSENQIAYMIDNGLETTIRDFYVAKNASPDLDSDAGKVTDFDAPEMKNIRESMKEAAGVLENPEEGYEKAKWLYEHDLPVTKENILKEKMIRDTVFPPDPYSSAKAAANAIAEGLPADRGDLYDPENIYEKAVKLEERYFSNDMYERSDISRRRQIEEIRLSMTAEVNVTLLKSGFAIDTAPIEQLLNELKIAEQAVALKYFPETAGAGDHDDNAPSMSLGSPEDAVKAYRLMNSVNEAVKEISSAPASSLGVFVTRPSAEIAFGEFERIALGEKERLHRAGESYEALMTEVRRDLGDSISKAFAGIDSILGDLGLEANDENRRHVKILSYNTMEITPENIERVAAADNRVRGVIDKMKPAAVLDMIRKGVNPLEKSFDDIEEFLDKRDSGSGYEKDADNYAKYLYSLDKNKEITEEEREAYIGIYRLIDRVESLSGAAIGAVVDSGMKLEFSNLLSAVRTRHAKGMDVKIDENTGLAEIITAGKSITDQIMSAFSDNSTEYYDDEARNMRQMAYFSENAAAFTGEAGAEETLENLSAAESLLSADEDFYKTLTRDERKESREKNERSAVRHIAEDAIDRIADSDDIVEEYQKILEEISKNAQSMTFDAGSVIDVRAMQQVNRQISLAVKAAGSGTDEYFVPVMIGDEVTGVRVSFIRSDESSRADISFKTPSDNVCRTHIEVWGSDVNMLINVKEDEDIKKFGSVADIFSAYIKEKGFELKDIKVIKTENPDNKHEVQSREASERRPEGAGRKQLFEISRDFLRAVKENYL